GIREATVTGVQTCALPILILPRQVPYAVITPPGYRESGPFPLRSRPHGRRRGRQSLIDCQPLFESLVVGRAARSQWCSSHPAREIGRASCRERAETRSVAV